MQVRCPHCLNIMGLHQLLDKDYYTLSKRCIDEITTGRPSLVYSSKPTETEEELRRQSQEEAEEAFRRIMGTTKN